MKVIKRFALQRKIEGKIEYASHTGWYGAAVPHVPKTFVGDLQRACLFETNQLDAIRNGKTTRSLLEEHLSDFELVEVTLSLKENVSEVEPGDFVYSLDVNTKERIYSTVTRIEIDGDDNNVKVFSLNEIGLEGFDYLEEVTLICKKRNRLDV